MKHGFPCTHSRRNERGVALIIVLGFLGLMVMMAVAFMIQARVERMVADSTLEGMRARQIAQTAIAAATQDYMNYIKSFEIQSEAMDDLFLSGDLKVTASYHYSDLYYGSTNLWCGEAWYWLPPYIKSAKANIDFDDIQDMEWIWVREKPNNRSRILGRYAYACFNLSGGVDANLLGRDFGTSPVKYGAATNRNNVRKMVMDAISSSPSDQTTRQEKLARYQAMWQGFDTPVALAKLTDGEINTGDEKERTRWEGVDIDETQGGQTAGGLNTDNLSCYSYSATHMGDNTTDCTVENIVNNLYFSDWVSEMGGDKDEVELELADYFDSSSKPKGTNYPSVKAVPMFNEIMTEVQLVKPDESPDGKWQLKVTLTPEFWCPFPSRASSPTCTLKPPSMGGGSAQSSPSDDVWVRILGTTSAGVFQPTLTQKEVSPPELTVTCTDKPATPGDPGKFVYTLDIDGIPEVDGSQLAIKQLRVATVIFQNGWTLNYDGTAVDSTPPVDHYPDKLSITISPNTLSPTTQGNTGVGYIEVDDPRLNHIAGRWALSSEGSIGKTNTCVDAAKAKAQEVMGYAPGDYMFCRNGDMETPAELGFIPICDTRNTPWVTLNIFSEYGIPLMNSLVCDTNMWDIMNKQKYEVYYTNGTINPYTRNTNILNGVFFGLSSNEVPNMSSSAGRIDKSLAGLISKVVVSDTDPSNSKFIKDGPGGWTRALRSKEIKDLNKNQRVMLAHNTWGLFNESDSLFLVFVIAQSITEAPEKVNPVGDWNEKEDMITGERWAVALCWMDTSREGSKNDLAQEMDIIMFKYLNE